MPVVVQTVREQNKKLSKDLKQARAELESARGELEGVKKFTREAHGKSRTELFVINVREISFG